MSTSDEGRRTDFDRWITEEFAATVSFTALVVLVEIAGIKVTPLCSTYFNVIGDEVDWGEITVLFAEYRAEAEKVVQAEVVSAFPLSQEQQAGIVAALKKRLGREVSLKSSTDETMVGGAVIRAGDLVIDGSVTGHLDRLASALSH